MIKIWNLKKNKIIIKKHYKLNSRINQFTNQQFAVQQKEQLIIKNFHKKLKNDLE